MADGHEEREEQKKRRGKRIGEVLVDMGLVSEGGS